MATQQRTPLGMQKPFQMDFSDPARLEKLAMTMDPQVGQMLLSTPPEHFQMPTTAQPQAGYMDMLSPRNENGVNLSPKTQAKLQQGFDSGAQASAEGQVPLEAFGGAGPAMSGGAGGGINWMALLQLAGAMQSAGQRQPQVGQAYAIAPSNQWKGFQAQPMTAPATRQRAGSLAQILGMR